MIEYNSMVHQIASQKFLLYMINDITPVQEPQIIIKNGQPDSDNLCIFFKLKDGRKPPICDVQLNGQRISKANYNEEYNADKNMFKVSIPQSESTLSGVCQYKLSTAEVPEVSTVVKVNIESDSSKLASLKECHACVPW